MSMHDLSEEVKPKRNLRKTNRRLDSDEEDMDISEDESSEEESDFNGIRTRGAKKKNKGNRN